MDITLERTIEVEEIGLSNPLLVPFMENDQH